MVTTVGLVVASVVSADGTAIEAAVAGAAMLVIFAVGAAAVVALENWLRRQSETARQSAPARERARFNLGSWLDETVLGAVAASVGGLGVLVGRKSGERRASLDLLLQESLAWLEVLKADPPGGWTPHVLRDQEMSLEDLQRSLDDPELDPASAKSLGATLTGYVVKMRRNYEGASVSEVLQRRTDG